MQSTEHQRRYPRAHPQFHDRTRLADVPFSAEALEWADRFRGMSRTDNEVWAQGLWPADRPARHQVGHAAFRTPLRAAHKMVLLGLCAIADADGVCLFHTGRMTVFCGVTTAELFNALDALTAPAAMAAVSWSSDAEWSREHVVLLRRPECWGWSRPYGLAPAPDSPAHVVAGNPPATQEGQSAFVRATIRDLAAKKRMPQ